MDELVATLVLRRPDGAELVLTISESVESLRRGGEVVTATELLPGEDPALLPGPDRFDLRGRPHPAGEGDAAMSDLRRTTRWTVENTLSSAGFTVRNLGVRTVAGTVPVTYAWVEVDDDGSPVRVEADLDLAGVDTGHARRDRDLRQPRLLDTARYPVLRFRGGPGHRVDGGWTVRGVLSAHGRDVAVDLAVRGDAGRWVVTAGFDRVDLGIRAPRLLIGRRVEVRIDAVLRR